MPQEHQSERSRLVGAARGAWVSRLIDLSRRNNLLFFQSTATNCISIPAESLVLADILAGTSVSADRLFAEREGRTSRVLSLARKAQENSEEKGLQTLYLAVGFLRWPADDGGRGYACPALLFPVQMKQKGRDLTAVELQVAGEPKLNPVLCHIFSSDFDVHLHEEELLAPLPEGRPGQRWQAGGKLHSGIAAGWSRVSPCKQRGSEVCIPTSTLPSVTFLSRSSPLSTICRQRASDSRATMSSRP